MSGLAAGEGTREMPEVTVNGVRLHYLDEGTGPEVVVFSHGYLLDHRHFLPQIEALSGQYRCLAYDHRGHGQSQVSSSGYEMESLYEDAVGFIEALECAPCHFVGLSTGGFVGLRLGLRRPDLLRSLALLDTSAHPERLRSRLRYGALFGLVRLAGYRPVKQTVLKLLLGPVMLNDPGRRDEVVEWGRRLTSNDRMAMVRFGRGIIRRAGVLDRLGDLRTPTLVLVGEHDAVTPPSRSKRMAAAIPDAELVVVPNSGHLSAVEQPAAVSSALQAFLSAVAERDAPRS